MQEELNAPPTAPEETRASPPMPATEPRAGLLRWIAEGLRASLLRAPRIDAKPTPGQLFWLVLLPELLGLALGRLQIEGPAQFHPLVMLTPLWWLAVLAWLGWYALSGPGGNGRLARWFALAVWATLPASLLQMGLSLGYARGWLPPWLQDATVFWTIYGLGYLWLLLAFVRLTAREATSRWRTALFVPGILAMLAVGFWQSIQSEESTWTSDATAAAETQTPRPRLELSQEVFEAQQALTARTLAGIAERQPGHANVYGLVFAPYASEDVFLRESSMVTELLEERFDAKGRVVHLMNHATTTGTLPWATPQNLQRSLVALSKVMDRENDLLVIYMTSHGARDHKLAAAHWPLTVPWLTPEELRKALDEAGIRHRVVAISACFSGGWIEPLADDNTLVMTAADAEHTSYGCGRLSELTFFGRAMFDEELRKTHSFETAFKAAVPLIQQREIEAGKDDGFSNPQIRVGEKIRPLLDQLAQRLDAAGK